jgi:hypothetical protein
MKETDELEAEQLQEAAILRVWIQTIHVLQCGPSRALCGMNSEMQEITDEQIYRSTFGTIKETLELQRDRFNQMLEITKDAINQIERL